MAGPRNATTDNRGRTYKWRDETFTSVTTILSRGVPKPALTSWAARMAAEFAVDNVDQIRAIASKGDKAAAIDMVRGAPWRNRDAAAVKGSDVHAAVESLVLGQPMPERNKDIAPSMEQFDQFLIDFAPKFEMSEASVFSRTHHYAGTLDLICEIHNERLLVDVKTGKDVYGEAALQLAAYRYADFIGLPDGSEIAVPEVDGCAVLHIRPRSYKLVPIAADATAFRFFLYAQQVAHFCDEVSRTVIGAPMGTNESPLAPTTEVA